VCEEEEEEGEGKGGSYKRVNTRNRWGGDMTTDQANHSARVLDFFEQENKKIEDTDRDDEKERK
jgi:hypothetical protein